ncbi:hypothetical protein V6N13_123554 [Hibiscus sabdariffa]
MEVPMVLEVPEDQLTRTLVDHGVKCNSPPWHIETGSGLITRYSWSFQIQNGLEALSVAIRLIFYAFQIFRVVGIIKPMGTATRIILQVFSPQMLIMSTCNHRLPSILKIA